MVIRGNDILTFDLVDFELFVQNQPFDNGVTYTNLKFSVIKNCCGLDEKVYDVTFSTVEYEEDLSVVANNLVLDTSEFKEDVYIFKFQYESDNGDLYETVVCYFYEIDMACRIADYIYKNGTTAASGLYEILIRTNECKCNCDASCAIYKEILKELDGQGECNC